MNFKVKRKLKFYKKQTYYINTKDGTPLYTTISDGQLIKTLSECAAAAHIVLDEVYQPYYDEIVIVSAWATKKQFMNFVTSVVERLDSYIKGVEF